MCPLPGSGEYACGDVEGEGMVSPVKIRQKVLA